MVIQWTAAARRNSALRSIRGVEGGVATLFLLHLTLVASGRSPRPKRCAATTQQKKCNAEDSISDTNIRGNLVISSPFLRSLAIFDLWRGQNFSSSSMMRMTVPDSNRGQRLDGCWCWISRIGPLRGVVSFFFVAGTGFYWIQSGLDEECQRRDFRRIRLENEEALVRVSVCCGRRASTAVDARRRRPMISRRRGSADAAPASNSATPIKSQLKPAILVIPSNTQTGLEGERADQDFVRH